MRTFRYLPLACLALGLLGCGTPLPNPYILEVHGHVLDEDTAEPIAGALVFVRHSGDDWLVGEELFTHHDMTTTDDSGRFAIPGHLSPNLWMWLWETQHRGFFTIHHASYGYGHPNMDREPDGGFVLYRSLMDSQSATREAVKMCREHSKNWSSKRMCPFDPDTPYANGRPRHRGESWNDGVTSGRKGDWVFFYEDGSVAVRGQYAGYDEVGRWEFFDRKGSRTKCIGKPYRPPNPRVVVIMQSAEGGTFFVPEMRSFEPCDDTPPPAPAGP